MKLKACGLEVEKGDIKVSLYCKVVEKVLCNHKDIVYEMIKEQIEEEKKEIERYEELRNKSRVKKSKELCEEAINKRKMKIQQLRMILESQNKDSFD